MSFDPELIVKKIHARLESTDEVPDELYDEFGKACANALRRQMKPRVPRKKGTISMSNLGRPDRYLWFSVNMPDKAAPISASSRINFIYGDLAENLLITLTKAAGFSVTDEQQNVRLYTGHEDEYIRGRIDCRIEGVLCDIKSASSYSYNTKFKEGGLESDDPFGYLAQLRGYDASCYEEEPDDGLGNTHTIRRNIAYTADRNPFFLVIDKSNGNICTYRLRTSGEGGGGSTLRCLQKEVRRKLNMVEQEELPPRCYPLEPDGKSGNMKLGKNCSYCDFRYECYKDVNNGKGLRIFKQKTWKGFEPKYLAEVKREPRIEEIEKADVNNL